MFFGDFWGGLGLLRDGGGSRAAGVSEEVGSEILLSGLLGAMHCLEGCPRRLFDGEAEVVIAALGSEFGLIDLENGLVRDTHRLGGSAMNFLELTGDAAFGLDGRKGGAEITIGRVIHGAKRLFDGLVEGGIVVRNGA